MKQLQNLQRSYFELEQVFGIWSRHYSVPVFTGITNMFFDILMNGYLLSLKVYAYYKVDEKKNDTVTMSYSKMMLICYQKVNLSSENNILENKPSSFNETFQEKIISTDEDWKFLFYESIQFIIYATFKLLLLIFSLDFLAKCKTTTLDVLKR